VSINPLPSHNINSRWARHKTPGVIGNEGIILDLHNRAPIGIGQCITNGAGNWRHGHNMEIEAIHGLCEVGLATHAHRVRICDQLDGDRASSSRVAGTTDNNLCASSKGSRTDSTRGRRGTTSSGLRRVHRGSGAQSGGARGNNTSGHAAPW